MFVSKNVGEYGMFLDVWNGGGCSQIGWVNIPTTQLEKCVKPLQNHEKQQKTCVQMQKRVLFEPGSISKMDPITFQSTKHCETSSFMDHVQSPKWPSAIPSAKPTNYPIHSKTLLLHPWKLTAETWKYHQQDNRNIYKPPIFGFHSMLVSIMIVFGGVEKQSFQ